ncbi:MAG: aminoacyl-histidine dipeptidase, partial [Clostridia bacterium]|nr:aminoacyl-histidine dipeptidase [Clostridia bacterium]
SNHKPESLFRYFEEICSIPHGSGNEEQIAQYLCNFAKENGLEYYRDEYNNVLIKKNASSGYENKDSVLLQGHTDMVCEKNGDTIHDFENDGLKLYEKDGWLFAEGTTLGADDGAGIALMMAILSDKDAKHPALECLFTVQEETGMDGAINFDYSKIRAKSFINLDSETLDNPIVSCAGGFHTSFKFNFEQYKFQNNALSISVKGLAGGHSGTDINSGRANANIVMGRLLSHLYSKMPFNLISIKGGNKTNAIPRECEAIISVFDKKAAKEILSEKAAEIKKSLVKADKKMSVRIDKAKDFGDSMFCFKDTSKIISAITLSPNGVIAMSNDMKGLVESSSNLGIVKTENNNVILEFMPRSSVDSMLLELETKFEMLGKLLGAEVEHTEKHPGWKYSPNSNVRKIFADCYERKFGKKPNFEAIHAGLECGVIISNVGEMDGISICAEVLEIHTPNECMNLKSFADCHQIVLEMLERM